MKSVSFLFASRSIGLRRSTKMAVVGRIDQGPAASAFDDPNCVPRTLARVCPQTFSLSWTSRAAQRDARRHGARPHATAGSCFGGRLDWCRHLPSRCVSSRTVTTARSSHLCPPRAGRVPRPDPSNNATRPSCRPQPLGWCGRRDDVHAALPRRLRNATPRFPLRGPLALSLSPSESRPAPRSGAKLTAICASPLQPRASPSQLVLDKESFTLEELLEEDDVIQECKSLNSRLVNLCVPPAKPRSRPATRHAHAFPLRVRRSFSRASSNQPSPRMFRSFVASSAASSPRRPRAAFHAHRLTRLTNAMPFFLSRPLSRVFPTDVRDDATRRDLKKKQTKKITQPENQARG